MQTADTQQKVASILGLLALWAMALWLPLAGRAQEHEAVDLGLPSGTQWATCNIGAASPEQVGAYFAWGQTDLRATDATYTWEALGLREQDCGTAADPVKNQNICKTTRDAARALWGKEWSMPSWAQARELVSNCEWHFVRRGGVAGYQVRSLRNGASIFLPATGLRTGTETASIGSFGSYWTGTRSKDYASDAFYLVFDEEYYNVGSMARFAGAAVRPVRSAPTKGAAPRAVPISWQGDALCAVAFLGYYSDFPHFKESPAYADLCRRYPQLEGIDGFAAANTGEELYLVVPRHPQCTVEVRDYSFESFLGQRAPEDEALVYRQGNGGPFLLRGNASDALPNVQVSIASPAGTLSGYTPHLDIQTGDLAYAPQVQDMGFLGALPQGEPVSFCEPPRDGSQPSLVFAQVKNGYPMVRFADNVEALTGIMSDVENQQARLSQWRRVEGMNGVAQEVFIGNIGNGTNPMLVVRMTDGTVAMMGLFYRYGDGDFRLSSRLPGLTGIKGFVEAGGGPYLMNGDTAYEYVTIYALDRQDRRHEIMPFVNDLSNLTAKVSQDMLLSLTLRPDNRMSVNLMNTANGNALFAEGHFYDNGHLEGTPENDYAAEYDFDIMSYYDPDQKWPLYKGTFRLAINHSNASQVFFTPLSGFTFGMERGRTVTLRLGDE